MATNLVLDTLRQWIENPEKPKLGQNLKYDKHIFANHGLQLNGIVHDTLLQAYVLESHRPHNMDSLALHHLGVKTISYDEVTGKGVSRINFNQVDIERATQYAAEDADITMQLHQHLHPQIEGDTKLSHIYHILEMPVLEVLFEIERNGVLLDIKLLEVQSRELGEKMLLLEQQAFAIAGQPFNLNSPKQIQEILFNQLKLPIIKKHRAECRQPTKMPCRSLHWTIRCHKFCLIIVALQNLSPLIPTNYRAWLTVKPGEYIPTTHRQ